MLSPVREEDEERCCVIRIATAKSRDSRGGSGTSVIRQRKVMFLFAIFIYHLGPTNITTGPYVPFYFVGFIISMINYYYCNFKINSNFL